MATITVHKYTDAEKAALVECENFSATIDGIHAMGGGATRAEAIEALATLLGDFVLGRDGSIAKMMVETGYKFSLPCEAT